MLRLRVVAAELPGPKKVDLSNYGRTIQPLNMVGFKPKKLKLLTQLLSR